MKTEHIYFECNKIRKVGLLKVKHILNDNSFKNIELLETWKKKKVSHQHQLEVRGGDTFLQLNKPNQNTRV